MLLYIDFAWNQWNKKKSDHGNNVQVEAISSIICLRLFTPLYGISCQSLSLLNFSIRCIDVNEPRRDMKLNRKPLQNVANITEFKHLTNQFPNLYSRLVNFKVKSNFDYIRLRTS